MFRVAIKESAIAQNERVREFSEEVGRTHQFESRETAEKFTEELCHIGAEVRLQATAPQESANIDAYLVKDGQANEFEPIETGPHGATFAVGANVYGGLGIAVVCPNGKTSPALAHYFENVASASDRGRISAIEIEPRLRASMDAAINWQPDLRVEVSSSASRSDRIYFAEVKSGSALFQRRQRADMQRVATEYGVLKIRALLDELSDHYTVQITKIEPNEWPA